MFKKKKAAQGELYSPLSGRIVPLSEVNDAVFSEEMLGKGFAVIPEDKMLTLKMPSDGRIVSVSGTSHAVNIIKDDGLELLIHVGIDTVELRGNGFELLCSEGDELSCGAPIMTVDFTELKRHGKDTVTPVVITNPEAVCKLSCEAGKCDGDGYIALRYVKEEKHR